jgi:hypothetical protein
MITIEELLDILLAGQKDQESQATRRADAIVRMINNAARDTKERERGTDALAELRRRFLGSGPILSTTPLPPLVLPLDPLPIDPADLHRPISTPPMPPPAPITAPVVTPKPPAPPFSIDPANPGPFPGENAALTDWVLQNHVSPISGIDWRVHKGIMVQENGHFGKDPNARAWIDGNNPAGMLNTAATSRMAGCISKPGDGNKYAVFINWYYGFLAHGHFLARDNYDMARTTDDPLKQAEFISQAGYAGGSSEWLPIVQSLIRQYQRTGPSTQARPAPSISTNRLAAVARWRSALKRGITYSMGGGGSDPTGPWSKSSDCSAFLDKGWGISRDDTGLNTDALVRDGRSPGGLMTQVSFDEALPGDGLVVGAGNGHEYGHCAGITEIDTTKTGKDKLKAVIDCASGRGDDSIREGSPARLLERGAIVVRYHGLLA